MIKYMFKSITSLIFFALLLFLFASNDSEVYAQACTSDAQCQGHHGNVHCGSSCFGPYCNYNTVSYDETCDDGECKEHQVGSANYSCGECPGECLSGGGGGDDPDYMEIKGRVTNSQNNNIGLSNVPIRVVASGYDPDDDSTYEDVVTDDAGYYSVPSLIEDDEGYSVRPAWNFSDDFLSLQIDQAPPGHNVYAHPSNNTESWIDCNNEDRHTPWTRHSYECQNAGRDDDCAQNGKCNFAFNPICLTNLSLAPSCGVFGGETGTFYWTGTEAAAAHTYIVRVNRWDNESPDWVSSNDWWVRTPDGGGGLDGWAGTCVSGGGPPACNLELPWTSAKDFIEGTYWWSVEIADADDNRYCGTQAGGGRSYTVPACLEPTGTITGRPYDSSGTPAGPSQTGAGTQINMTTSDTLRITSVDVQAYNGIGITHGKIRTCLPTSSCGGSFPWDTEYWLDAPGTSSTHTWTEDDSGNPFELNFATTGVHRVTIEVTDNIRDADNGRWCGGYDNFAIIQPENLCDRTNVPHRLDHLFVNVSLPPPPTGSISGTVDGVTTVGSSTIITMEQDKTLVTTATANTVGSEYLDREFIETCPPSLNCALEANFTRRRTCVESGGTQTDTCVRNINDAVFNQLGVWRVAMGARSTALRRCEGFDNTTDAFCDRTAPVHIDDYLRVNIIPARHDISGDIGEVDAADLLCANPVDTGIFDPVVGTIDVTWTRTAFGGDGSDLGRTTDYSILQVLGGEGRLNSTFTVPQNASIGSYELMCIGGSPVDINGLLITDLDDDLIADIGYRYDPFDEAWYQALDGDVYAQRVDSNVPEPLTDVYVASKSSDDFDVTLFSNSVISADQDLAEGKRFIRNYTQGFWPESFSFDPPPWATQITNLSQFSDGTTLAGGGVYSVSTDIINDFIESPGQLSAVYDLSGDGIAVIYVTQGPSGAINIIKPLVSSTGSLGAERILIISEAPVYISSDVDPLSVGLDPLAIQASIISKEDITFDTRGVGVLDAQIMVEGPLIAGNGAEPGEIDVLFRRYLEDQNATTPAETVKYNPTYLFDIEEESGLMVSDVIWIVE